MIYWHPAVISVTYLFVVGCTASSSAALLLHINTTKAVFTIDDRYVSYTLDWWPPTQGCQPWGWGPHANVLEVDLDSPKLRTLVSALGPSILRIGGSLDKVVEYEIPSEGVFCSSHNQNSSKDRRPCLEASRWDALHEFAGATNSKIVFGLSYPEPDPQNHPGRWDPSQALALLHYSYLQNYSRQTTLYGVELGEELTRYDVNTGAFDNYITAYQECALLLRSLWGEYNDPTRPLLMGPCPGMDWPKLVTWFPSFLERTKDVLDVAVYHSYNQIAPGQLYLNMTIPSGNLSTQHGVSPGDTGWQGAAMMDFVTKSHRQPSENNANKPPPALWLGEFGPHRGGGGPGNISMTFASSFGYLDTLGTLARLGHSLLARQTLVGGKYELLRCTTGDDAGYGCDLEPHPDYWVALLWRKLMGTSVLEAPFIVQHRTLKGDKGEDNWRKYLRFHAHCTRHQTDGSVTVAFSNPHPTKSFPSKITGIACC